MLSITLTPNREQGPFGFTRTTCYEFRITPDFEWEGGAGPIGAKLVPVVTIKEWRNGKFQSVRVSEHAKPQGLWHREWPSLPPAEMPELMRLEALTDAAIAGNITCGKCNKRRLPGIRLVEFAESNCLCPIDGTAKRAYTKRPEPENYATDDHAHGATTDRGTNGRNDSRSRPSYGAPDDKAWDDSRLVEKAARERRRSSGKAKARDEI
jgi:hypothetical protein